MKHIFKFWRSAASSLVLAALVLFNFHSISLASSSNPYVDLVTAQSFNQSNWDAGVGAGLTANYSAATNVDDSTTGQVTVDGWYDPAWAYRQAITVDNTKVAADLTDYPLLITENDFDSSFFNNVQSDGGDILFTSADGITPLEREVVSIDTVGSSLEAYVEIPTLSGSADTTIYIYYGNASANLTNDAGTWTTNYAAVYHFEEDPSISSDGSCGGGSYEICDSANGNHANALNSNFSSGNKVTGQLGSALQFVENPGSAGHVLDIASSASVNDLTNMSISLWLKGDPTPMSDQYGARIVSKTIGGSCTGGYEFQYDDTGDVYIAWDNQPVTANPVFLWSRTGTGNGAKAINSDADMTAHTAWNYIALTYANTFSLTDSKIYVNASETGSYLSRQAAGAPLASDAACGIRLGSPSNDTVRQLDATLDELRISSTTLSPNWLSTEYNNQNAVATFYSTAAQETLASYTGTLTSNIFDVGNTTSSWGIVNYASTVPAGTSIKVRTDSSSDMSGATAWGICSAMTLDTDISANSCVNDGDRYMQYQLIMVEDSGSFPVVTDVWIQSLNVNSATVAENAGAVTVTATLDAARSSGDVTVPFVVEGTASGSGTDHDLAAGNITITAGNTTGTATVNIVDDAIYEQTETIVVNMTTASVVNATAGNVTSYTLSITDNDSQPTLSVNDLNVNETDADTTATFTITASNPSYQNITVDYTTTNGTGSAGVDYTTTSGTATISAGSTSTTVVVTVAGNDTDESNRTFTLDLSNAANATISDAQGTATIIDDEGTPQLSVDDISVNETEANATATFTIAASNASDTDITFDYATSDGTATAGSDYTAVSGSGTISAGQTSTTVTVTIAGDTEDESNETLTLTLSNPVTATIADSSAIATIVDNDTTPALSVADISVVETESDVTATFTVTGSVSSTADATFSYETSDGTATAGSDYTAASGTGTISAGSTTTTISVTVAGDTDDESNETFTLTLSSPVRATISDDTAIATIVDNDETEVQSTPTGGTLFFTSRRANNQRRNNNELAATANVDTKKDVVAKVNDIADPVRPVEDVVQNAQVEGVNILADNVKELDSKAKNTTNQIVYQFSGVITDTVSVVGDSTDAYFTLKANTLVSVEKVLQVDDKDLGKEANFELNIAGPKKIDFTKGLAMGSEFASSVYEIGGQDKLSFNTDVIVAIPLKVADVKRIEQGAAFGAYIFNEVTEEWEYKDKCEIKQSNGEYFCEFSTDKM